MVDRGTVPSAAARQAPRAAIPTDSAALERQFDDNGNGQITCAEASAHAIAPTRCAPYGIGLAPVTLGARVAHAKAFTLGRTAQETEPASPAAREIADLYRWAMEAGVTKRKLADALQAAAEPKPAAKKTIPSRRGKRAWVTHLDAETSRPLKAAAVMSRQIHAVARMAQAAEPLIERYWYTLAFIAWSSCKRQAPSGGVPVIPR